MRALVTGGAGFIGSNLVHELHNRGWMIDIVDDLSSGNLDFLDPLPIRQTISALLVYLQDWESQSRKDSDILFIESDFENSDILHRVRNGLYDTIFHLAANPRVSYTVERPAATTDINCTRTLKLLEATRESLRKTRFVFSSTSAVYGNSQILPTSESFEIKPQSPYGLQKHFVEEYIRMACSLHGLDAVSLRYANVYGPRQLGDSAYSTAVSSWCNRIKDDEPLRSDGDGEQSRDMVFVKDVVEANILAAERDISFSGEAINIGTGISITNNSILSIFEKRFSHVKIVKAPERKGDVKHTNLDISKAKTLLGYKPHFDFESGMKLTWEWWNL